MEVPPAPPSSPLVQRKRRLDLPASPEVSSPLKKQLKGAHDASPCAVSALARHALDACASSVGTSSALGKSGSASENDPFLLQGQKLGEPVADAALAPLAVEGKTLSPPPPLAIRSASPALLRRVPVSSMTPGNLLGASTASLAGDGRTGAQDSAGVDHVAALASRIPPLFASRRDSEGIDLGKTTLGSPLRVRRMAVDPVAGGAADGAHAVGTAGASGDVRGEGTPRRGHHVLGAAGSGAASPMDSREDLGRSRTPPRRGETPRNSLSRLDSVLPATPPRLPCTLFYEQLRGRAESPRSPVASSVVAPGLQALGGEGTPLGGARRPRDSFEFALTDEAATPSPFSRSKRRNRGEEGSPLRGDPAPVEVGPRSEANERQERRSEMMEAQSPFRRSPITGKRQCVVSPMRLTPARQSPACFRDGRGARGPNDKWTSSCPTWLKRLASSTPAFFRGVAPRERSPVCSRRPAEGSEDGDTPHFLGSLLALAGVASPQEQGGESKPVKGDARENLNALLHAVTALKLETLEKLNLGRDLERLWRHYRTLRIVCDREHDSSRRLGLSSQVFPAFQRLTHASASVGSVLASAPLNTAQPGELESLSEACKSPGAQTPSQQLEVDDIARMLWLAPHLLGWRYRHLKTSAGPSPRLAMGAAALTTSPLSRRRRPAPGEEESAPLSPLKRNLVLISGERLAEGLELELLEFVLSPEDKQAATLRTAKEPLGAPHPARDSEGAPQVVLMSREVNPTLRLVQFRGVLVLWVFLWQLEYLKQLEGACDVARLSGVFENAWLFLTRGQWVPGFHPDATPLPPCHALPPRPAKTLLRSPSKGGIGRDRSAGDPLLSAPKALSPQKTALLSALLSKSSSPIKSAHSNSSNSPAAFSSPLSRRRLGAASPGGSTGLLSASTPTRGDERGRTLSRDGAPAQAEGERLVYRLSGADTRLSTSSVSSRISDSSGVGATRAGSPVSPAKSPQAAAEQTTPRRDASAADISSPVSSVRSGSAGASPISERLRQRTEARRQARLQQEELRKQRAGLHQEARQWSNVRWVLSCLLDACVYRDPRKTIDTRVFVDVYIAKSKLPLRLDVVEECLATLARVAPDMLSLNGSVVSFASAFDAAALVKLVDTRVVEAQKAAAAFDTTM
ncbi:hypothetical protein TGPRC2_247040 [Toxoplasma gondii TgCatPRC2]|uniref:Uncharacterized protein n=1 Tax=Toxoplasma gondii TgCatPRC2 TaxID=1130821 RepID=A0A151HG88_TOXGO|nr:hypothetical protein TGPRC2_247040 [Toxoplasma gondii TgCatPRC2]